MSRRTGTGATVITVLQLGQLLQKLRASGFSLVGPTVRSGAIVHAEISGIEDLPRGWTEVQQAGRYALARREDESLFGFSSGPQSWKQLFFAPRVRQWTGRLKEDGYVIEQEPTVAPKLALIGARSCDLHAIEIQDRTFLKGPYVDPDYAARREGLFVVAVNCGQAGGTCFCVSMQTGPKATWGFDLALTELLDDQGHRFLVEVASERGEAYLSALEQRPAKDEEVRSAEACLARTAASMGRTLDTSDIQGLMARNLEHPRWSEVAERCLACTNCTLACPTCFCASVEDVTDLRGETTERWRRWDSCFTLDHSYLHGGSVRTSIRSRYRQWLTHKVATWIDQFGTSGCVGCGRCITWCPVGIDITEEISAIRKTDGAR